MRKPRRRFTIDQGLGWVQFHWTIGLVLLGLGIEGARYAWRRFTPVAVLALTLCSCTGSLAEARYAGKAERIAGAKGETPTSRCVELDSRRTTYGAIAKGAAVLAGASGVSTIPLEGDRYEEARIGVAAGGIAFAAVAAGALVVSEGAGEAWVRECE